MIVRFFRVMRAFDLLVCPVGKFILKGITVKSTFFLSAIFMLGLSTSAMAVDCQLVQHAVLQDEVILTKVEINFLKSLGVTEQQLNDALISEEETLSKYETNNSC